MAQVRVKAHSKGGKRVKAHTRNTKGGGRGTKKVNDSLKSRTKRQITNPTSRVRQAVGMAGLVGITAAGGLGLGGAALAAGLGSAAIRRRRRKRQAQQRGL